LEAIRLNGSHAVAKFERIASVSAAEALKGTTLLADRNHLQAVSPGGVFLSDLIGFKLVDAAGRDLGHLAEIRQAGSLEFFMVEGPFDILLPTQTEFASLDQVKGVATLGFELEP
jgi:ribosomal 30S subunit maturation factor RimM